MIFAVISVAFLCAVDLNVILQFVSRCATLKYLCLIHIYFLWLTFGAHTRLTTSLTNFCSGIWMSIAWGLLICPKEI